MKLRRELLEFILRACRKSHPRELAGILRSKKGILEEVLFLPGTLSSGRGAVLRMEMLGIHPGACGTVHSHPSPDPSPSEDDLRFFEKFGSVHLIVAYPYTPGSWAAYDHRGEPLEVEVVE